MGTQDGGRRVARPLLEMVVRSAAAVCRRLPPIRGKGALAQWCWAHSPSMAPHWRMRTAIGKLELPTKSVQTWTVAFTGQYDTATIKFLREYIGDGVVLDLGASLGLYSLQLARLARQVIAIEPVRANCSVIETVLALNAVTNVELRRIALARTRGVLELRVEDGGAGNAAVVSDLAEAEITQHQAAGHLFAVEQVEAIQLDELDVEGRCSFVKMDVEGFELDVLRGGTGFIARHRPVIFGEFSPAWMRSRGYAEDAVVEWATQHDYEVRAVTMKRLSWWRERQPVLSSVDARENLLLLPRPGA